jgi:hypothetical protein
MTVDDRDPDENMKVTGFELPGESKRSKVKEIMERMPKRGLKLKINSVTPEHKSMSFITHRNI